jgi:MBG domain (YGX type)
MSGGLVASTLDMGNVSPNGANQSFSGNGSGSVVNQGTINAADGGYVALLGNQVSNQGAIAAPGGTVALGAGSAATLTFSDNSLVHMQVDRSVLNSVAENGGLIQADAGKVIMTAGAKHTLLASVVNNTGMIEARTVEDHDGTIILRGGMEAGTVDVGGTLDASAPNGGNGGSIETSAAHVKVANDAKVTTVASPGQYGLWLIDPQNYTVAASGGDITGATLSTELQTTPVTLQSSGGGTAGAGNVNVNDAITWSADTTLTLTASNNININANITATGNTASLVINPNTANGVDPASGTGVFNLNNASVTLSGTNPGLSIASIPYTVINSLGVATDTTVAPTILTLQGMASASLAGHHALGSNIDATVTSTWNGSAGFTPIGSVAFPFDGTFEGLGHTISNVTVNLPANADVGLFGSTGTASIIRDVGLTGGSVVGLSSAGMLVGSNTGTINDDYATGSVSGGSSLGGLMGSTTGPVSNSYATGNVTGTSSLGGLMGSSTTGPVTDSYATGNVNGTSSLGGLMGSNTGPVSNSYATGSVTGTSSVGGLMGSNTGPVSDTYSTGAVSGTTSVGGLMGSNTNTVSNSYWNTGTSGQSSSPGGTGLTSAQMQQSVNFQTWDFTGTWIIYSGLTDPLLRFFMTPLAVTANNDITTYNGLAFSGGNGVAYSITPNGNLLGTVSYSGTSQAAVNIGACVITPGGLSSNQQGYIISYSNGTLTISPAPLTITADSASKTYGATTSFAGTAFTDSGLLNSDTVTSVTLASAGAPAMATVAGSPYAIVPSAAVGSGLSNYTISYVNGALTVNTAPLTVTANSTSKTYGATTSFVGTEFTDSGLLNSDTVAGATLTSPGAPATATVTGSPYAIVPSAATGSGLSNYSISYVNGSLAVNTAPLTVIANSTSKTYGTTATLADTAFTDSGLLNSDTVTSVTLNSVGAPATATVAGGPYAIVPSAATGSGLSNYAISYVNGTLTVNAAASTTPPGSISDATMPLESILNATMQPESNLLSSEVLSCRSRQAPDLKYSTCPQPPDGFGDRTAANTSMSIGKPDPVLGIVNGGMKLSNNGVNAGE